MSPGESQMLGTLKPEHVLPLLSVTNRSQSSHNQSQTVPGLKHDAEDVNVHGEAFHVKRQSYYRQDIETH